ncbi:hypothetical protein OA870_01705 [Bacteroidota bacterium]|nr:hypothetical protein [Bacteroidota bacterium]
MNLKKLFFIIFCIPITITAQVPQVIGYQGVAADATGFELINQSISIRASIISGSANGTVEWQETHSSVTDSFGLFTISIGQGISTGSGQSSSFEEIQWGSGNHYLKIEMDATGGSNFLLISTSQMMSVPYALYAKNANINYDSIATILANDSTFANNIISDKSGSCNFNYPDGIYGDVVIWDVATSGDYVIPAGKNFYLQWVSSSSSDYLYVNGQKILTVPGTNSGTTASSTTGSRDNITLTQTLIFKEGDILSFFNTSGIKLIAGLLTEKKVEALISADLVSNTYTVPIGKRLVIKGIYANYNSYSFLRIDNKRTINIDHHLLLNEPIIVNEGTLIDLDIVNSNYHNGIIFNGYLVDEDYFENCRSGFTSSLNNSLNNASVLYSPSNYPQNIYEGSFFYFSTSVGLGGSDYFVVPSGKNLYLDDITQSGVSCRIVSSGNILEIGSPSFLDQVILCEGDTIEIFHHGNTSSTGIFYTWGYLVDINNNIDILKISLDSSSFTYTVPSDKKLIVELIIADAVNDITVTLENNQSFTAYPNMPTQAHFLDPNTTIQANLVSASNPKYIIIGYLIDHQ